MLLDDGLPEPETCYTDRAHEPAPIRCEQCSAPQPWRWIVPPERLQPRHRPRWVRPYTDPCRACERRNEDRDRERLLERRQRDAGVPARCRPFRWAARLDADCDSSDEAIEAWVSSRRKFRWEQDRFVVHGGNRDAAKLAMAWKPGGKSLWFRAGPGRGKTLLAAMLATELLSPMPMRQVGGGPGDPVVTLSGPGCPSVLMVDEQELHDRVKAAWHGDQAPLLQIASVQVLILDDLGTVTTDHEWVRANIERVVDYRYRAGLPMIITSNAATWEAATEHGAYGRRAASRLADMRFEMLSLRGPDWRTA